MPVRSCLRGLRGWRPSGRCRRRRVEARRQPVDRRAAGPQQRVERRPLGVPRAGRPLEVVTAGGVQQRGDEPGHLHRRGAGADRRDRVVLVGHRRRSAGAVGALGELADVAGHQGDELVATSPTTVPTTPQAPAMRAIGVRTRRPRAVGDGEAEPLGDAGGDLGAARPVRRSVADRPAELRPAAIRSQRAQRARRLAEPAAPAAGDVGERRRHGELAERAPDHRRRPVGAGESRRRASAASPSRSAVSAAARAATTIAAVSRMSWLVAPRWTYSAAVAADRRRAAARRARSPGRHRARSPRRAASTSMRSTRQPRRSPRRRRRGSRRRRLGGGERRLDVELRLQPRRRRRRFGDRAAGDEVGERIGVRSPGRRTHRHPGGGCRSGTGLGPSAVGDEQVAAFGGDGCQRRIGVVGGVLLGEVDARDDAVEQAAGEHRHRRGGAPAACRRRVGTAGGLRVWISYRPSPSVGQRANRPSACHVSIRASGTGAPAPSVSVPWTWIAAGSVGGDGEAQRRVGEGDVQERADRLRRRQRQRLSHRVGSSNGVRSGPRRTMSKRNPSAHSAIVVSWS